MNISFTAGREVAPRVLNSVSRGLFIFCISRSYSRAALKSRLNCSVQYDLESRMSSNIQRTETRRELGHISRLKEGHAVFFENSN